MEEKKILEIRDELYIIEKKLTLFNNYISYKAAFGKACFIQGN